MEKVASKAGDGLLNMEAIGKALFISDSDESIQALSDNIQWLIEDVESSADLGGRLHLEHSPDHPFLSPSHVSLVIECCGFMKAFADSTTEWYRHPFYCIGFIIVGGDE